MGKTKKNRPFKRKSNPIGIPSVKDFEELTDDDLDAHSPIQAIIDGLQSSNDDKMNALQNLAVITTNLDKVKLICQSDVARIAAPLLFDPKDEIRNSCAGALRNLSVCGIEVCEFLVEQDVMTPLLALLGQYAANTTWVPSFDKEMKDQLDLKSDTFLQSINLLWNLCESTSLALDNFNQSQLLNSFIRCMDYKIFGFDIAIGVAQCILVISEDNPSTWTILMENFVPHYIEFLNIDGNYQHVMLRTVVAGILSNVPAIAAAHSNQILTSLGKTLEINHKEVLNQTTSELPIERNPELHPEANDDNVMEDETPHQANLRHRKMDLLSDTEVKIRNVGFLLEAQRLSAEIISNQCSTEDEEWVDDDSDNEMVHDYEVGNNGSQSNLQNIDKIPVEILEVIKSLGLVEKLWQRAQPIPDNVFVILRESAPTLLKKFKGLRISALLCLQNLCNSMSCDDLGGANSIYNVWLDIGQQVFQGPQDPLIIEPATSLMRSTLEHLKNRPDLFKQMTENDLQMILKGLQDCTMSEIRANWLRMLGILGCLLNEVLVKLIMAFILDICQKEYDVWTISEGLDALMDMFENNDWHQISTELNLLQKTKDFERVLKNKMRQQKTDLKDRYPAVQTVRNNLQRFNKYLEKELMKYNATIN